MELLYNQVFWTALLANLLAQTLKLFLYYLLEGRFQWERFLETGGMPSSHSATVSALAVAVGLEEGFGSSLFAVAAVFALIVMYDATGIRRAAGLHAQLLNQLVQELQRVLEKGPAPEPLKELLGHTYLEVLVGALLGALVAFLSYHFFPAA
ncbi:divergent PAP2 family protein [Thermus brockianus]